MTFSPKEKIQQTFDQLKFPDNLVFFLFKLAKYESMQDLNLKKKF